MKHRERVPAAMKRAVSLFVTALLFASCQPNSFKIEGAVDGLLDGDTLLLSRDINNGLPTDTMIVSEGAFEYQGVTDTVTLALLYAQKDPELSTTLFLDHGTTKVLLSSVPAKTTIGGTAANDALQEANHLAYRYGEQMQKLSLSLCAPDLDSTTGLLAKAQMERLQHDLVERIIQLAERNLDNAFGHLIVENLEDEAMTPERRQRLLKKMR